MTSPAMNIYGRKWGRGLRPWLLIPKYVCVSLVLGGLGSIAVLGAVAGAEARSGELAHAILYYQVFPALGGATLLGTALLIHHGRVMLRMRWLWAKFAAIAVAGPIVHLLLKGQIAIQQSTPPGHMLFAATVACLAFVLVAIIGRLKPRLGQPFITRAKGG